MKRRSSRYWIAAGLTAMALAADAVAFVPSRPSDATRGDTGWGGMLGQMLGGTAQATAGYTFGAVTAKTVVGTVAGAAVGTHGIDNVQAGARQLWTGQQADTMSSGLLQSAGLSKETANTVNAVVSVATTLGTSAANMAAATGPVAAKSAQTFRHYGYAEDAAKFEGGLRPGGYATHSRGRPMHGRTAQERLALPHEVPPDAYYNGCSIFFSR